MCTSVLGAVDVQVPTPGCERVHRHHFLHTDFVDLQLETPTSGETERIYARVRKVTTGNIVGLPSKFTEIFYATEDTRAHLTLGQAQ